jgi:hypothetical protein
MRGNFVSECHKILPALFWYESARNFYSTHDVIFSRHAKVSSALLIGNTAAPKFSSDVEKYFSRFQQDSSARGNAFRRRRANRIFFGLCAQQQPHPAATRTSGYWFAKELWEL